MIISEPVFIGLYITKTNIAMSLCINDDILYQEKFPNSAKYLTEAFKKNNYKNMHVGFFYTSISSLLIINHLNELFPNLKFFNLSHDQLCSYFKLSCLPSSLIYSQRICQYLKENYKFLK